MTTTPVNESSVVFPVASTFVVELTSHALKVESIDPKSVEALALDFLLEQDSPKPWNTPQGADWQCNTASEAFVAWMHENYPEVPVEVLIATSWCEGSLLQEPAYSRALPVATAQGITPEDLFAHAMVWVCGYTLDLTRRQFQNDSKFPYVEPYRETEQHWRKLQLERETNGARIRLNVT